MWHKLFIYLGYRKISQKVVAQSVNSCTIDLMQSEVSKQVAKVGYIEKCLYNNKV